MQFFDQIHDLVMLLPPWEIRITPMYLAGTLMAIGAFWETCWWLRR